MHRRAFLAASTLAAIASPRARQTSSGRPLHLSIDPAQPLARIPRDFLGLGYEISSVAIPDLLSAANRTYVQLVRTLSPGGVIRVGGNTSDDSSFSAGGKALSTPKGTVVTSASIEQLGTFLHATDWRLIWGLNLGSTDERQAVAEAEAVAAAAKDRLLAFEIGNEPDLFGRGTGHRPLTYNYDAFLEEFRRYKRAVRAKLPNAPFAGPDAAGATDWVTRFAADEGSDLKLLTHHYYRQCAGPTSTLERLLHPDPKLAPQLMQLKAASAAARVPYRICETNSFCGGGQRGVSDTFGAALWVLDFLFTLPAAGCSGVNIETGVNQLGFVSWYSPIAQNERGSWVAKPEYYGMLAFAQCTGDGQLVKVECDAAGANLTAYAVATARELSLTVVNKEAAFGVDATAAIPAKFREARVLRLTAPSLDSKEGVTFGASSVAADGSWAPRASESLHSNAGRLSIHIPAASAAVIRFALSLVLGFLAVAAGLASAGTVDFSNPLLEDGPDPWVIYHDGFYYEMNSSGKNLIIRKSHDITELSQAKTKIVWTPPPAGPYSHDIWAPELHFLNGKWYIYFAADSGTNQTHRNWVIENSAADPLSGSWNFKGQLTDATDKWAVDPTVFEDSGKLYALWSGWPGDKNGEQDIYIGALSNPWTIAGQRHKLSSPEFRWERFGSQTPPFVAVNEGPEILKHGNKLFLVYSASGCWTDHYALGMLTADEGADLLNPKSWKKSPEPLFWSAPAAHAYGPGHNGFFRSPDGTQNWIAYHANPEPHEGCGNHRSLRIQQFTWNGDGTPNFGKPVPLGKPIPKPSGE